MELQSKKIKCPNCGQEINVDELLYHQLDEELKKKYDSELSKEKKKFEEQNALLEKQKKNLDDQRKEFHEKVEDGIKNGVKQERLLLEKELRKKIEDESSEQVKSLQEELNKKSSQLKEFNKAKSEIERLKREKDELKGEIEAESEKRLNEILKEEKDKIRKAESEKMQFKLSEREEVIRQLNEKLQEAQKKAEQGSMQLQGEVQELAIEEWLAKNFPFDTIQEIKKGARGGDCIQIINTRTKQNCGTIYYESKRTKDFQNNWIEKLKGDIREKGASLGVLVTEALPNDMDRVGLRDGVWVCTFEEFKGLSVVLRESAIRVSDAIIAQENKGDKMGMLYDYLTSDEFRLRVEAIVEGFTQMQSDLETEKRAMSGIWKKREKQIEKVILNTAYMYGSIKGIAGNAIQPITQLELPISENENLLEE